MSSNFDQRQWIFSKKYTDKKIKDKVDNEDFNDHKERHESGGEDEINLDGLQGESAELANHKKDYASNRRFVKSPYFIAHRGFSETHPENTLVATREALGRKDFFGIEVDVRMSSDGVFVLMHDATVDRTTNGTGTVANKTLTQLKELDAGSWKDSSFAGEQIPTLEEFFELCYVGGMFPYLEFKIDLTTAQAQDVINLIDKFNARGRVSIQSFNLTTLQMFRSLSSEISLAYHASITEENILAVKALGNARISSHHGTITPELMGLAREHGIEVETYTVNDLPTAISLFEMGVIGINSDSLQSPLTSYGEENVWNDIPLESGWGGWGGDSGRPQFMKKDGLVHLRGVLKNVGSPTTAVGTLPEGFRPEFQFHAYFATQADSFRSIEVRARVNGEITIPREDPSTISWVSFYGSFYAGN